MSAPSQGRRPARAAMWLLVVLATYWLYTALGAARAGSSGNVGVSLALSGLCLALAGWIGMRAARERLRVQEGKAAQAARMMLIAQLGRQDDATLERLSGGSGSSAEAARMILQGRHLGNPAGGPRPRSTESE